MRSGPVRSIGACLLGLVGVLLLVVSLISIWVRQTVSDGERIRELTAEAIADPTVNAALADRLTGLLFEAVDIESALASLLPDQLDRLGPVVADRAEQAVGRGVAAVLADPRTQAIVADLAEVAHGRALRVLRGDGLADGVTIADATVSLNLLPLVGAGVAQLQGLGLLRSLQLPPLPLDGDPAEQIAALETVLGRDLPDDFGQLVVYRSESVANAQSSAARAQDFIVFAERARWLIITGTVVGIVGSLLLARNRWHALALVGLGTLIATVVSRVLLELVVDRVPRVVGTPGGQAAIASISDGAVDPLRTVLVVVALIGAVLAALGLVATVVRDQHAAPAG